MTTSLFSQVLRCLHLPSANFVLVLFVRFRMYCSFGRRMYTHEALFEFFSSASCFLLFFSVRPPLRAAFSFACSFAWFCSSKLFMCAPQWIFTRVGYPHATTEQRKKSARAKLKPLGKHTHTHTPGSTHAIEWMILGQEHARPAATQFLMWEFVLLFVKKYLFIVCDGDVSARARSPAKLRNISHQMIIMQMNEFDLSIGHVPVDAHYFLLFQFPTRQVNGCLRHKVLNTMQTHHWFGQTRIKTEKNEEREEKMIFVKGFQQTAPSAMMSVMSIGTFVIFYTQFFFSFVRRFNAANTIVHTLVDLMLR